MNEALPTQLALANWYISQFSSRGLSGYDLMPAEERLYSSALEIANNYLTGETKGIAPSESVDSTEKID